MHEAFWALFLMALGALLTGLAIAYSDYRRAQREIRRIESLRKP